MIKLKTKSCAKKRFRKTANGKIKFGHAFRRKKLANKSRNRKRHLRKTGYLKKANAKHTARLIPYL